MITNALFTTLWNTPFYYEKERSHGNSDSLKAVLVKARGEIDSVCLLLLVDVRIMTGDGEAMNGNLEDLVGLE